MDRKSIIVLIICFLLMMLWMPLVNVIYPPKRVVPSTNTVVVPPAANGVMASNRSDGVSAPSSQAAISNPVLPFTPLQGAEPEHLVTFTNAEARYVFTSYGGGLQKVELIEYPATVRCGRARTVDPNKFVTLNQGAPLPALGYFAGPVLEDGTPFRLTPTPMGARAEKTLTNGLAIIKEFTIVTNHQLRATIRVENRGGRPIELPGQELTIGTATPINLLDNGQFIGLQWYDGASAQFINEPWFANHPGGCACVPGTPRTEYESTGTNNVVWGAVHNQFFTVIAAPASNALHLVARRVDLPPPGATELAEFPKAVRRPFGYQAALVYPPATLAPGAALERQVDLFAGPKEYNTLATLPKQEDLAMNFGKFFGWFAKVLLLSMNFLHGTFGLAYGLAIIVITVIIKLLFWPLTRASTRSMKRMQALQPQMKALQEKYKDDPKRMNVKLMEFMKENKVSPLGGCLPMVIQIPVFIGFYQMLQNSIELRGASFLWACDLSQPDTVAILAGFPINPLPLIMGATQLWQARLTPPSPGMDPVQAKMMQYMPLMFIFILYNFSSGLALYWTVQNLLSILQMKLTKASDPAHPMPPARPTPTPARKRG